MTLDLRTEFVLNVMLYFSLIDDNIGPSDGYQPLPTRFYHYQLDNRAYINLKKIEFALCEIPDCP